MSGGAQADEGIASHLSAMRHRCLRSERRRLVVRDGGVGGDAEMLVKAVGRHAALSASLLERVEAR